MDKSQVCYLSEIYSAIQGEGPLVGVRQIFIRFSVCDLRCRWCDTPDSLLRSDFCEVESGAGDRSFQKVENPILDSDLIKYIRKLKPTIHHSISLTGGEPLLQYNFLLSFLPRVRTEFLLPIYLETGGHRPFELKEVINFIDYVSMDFKLPSSAKVHALWDQHKDFLEISLQAKKNVWVKIVVTSDTLYDDLFTAVNLVKLVSNGNKPIEIFLQPVTELNGSKPPNEVCLLEFQSKLLKSYPHIRVLPQVHKLMSQR